MKVWFFLLLPATLFSKIQGSDDSLSDFPPLVDTSNKVAPFPDLLEDEKHEGSKQMKMFNQKSKEKYVMKRSASDFPELQKADDTADRLLSIMEKLTNKDRDADIRIMTSFLEECNKSDPYESMMQFGDKVEIVLRTQTTKASTDMIVKRINDALENLMRVATLQAMVGNLAGVSKEMLEFNFNKFEFQLELINANVRHVVNEMCPDYPITNLNPGDLEIADDCDIDATGMMNVKIGDGEFWKAAPKDKTKEVALVVIQSLLGVASLIPHVGGAIAGGFGPWFAYALKSEDKTSEMIYRGFQKINVKLDDIKNHLDSEIKLDIVRQIENTAEMLMNYLGQINQETDPEHKNRTIDDFLSKCARDKPFETILALKGQIKEVLSTQWDNDSLHSKRKINYLKERLFKNLKKLVIVYYVQHDLRVMFSNATTKERDDRYNQLNRNLEQIQTDTENFLKELAQRNYWDGMKKTIENVMQPSLSLSETANHVEKYLRDIYTSDKFCVITALKDEGGYESTEVAIHPADVNVLEFNYDKYHIRIVRSQLKYNTKMDEFCSASEKVVNECHDGSEEVCKRPPFTVIVKQFQNYFGEWDNRKIVRCTMKPACFMAVRCKPWTGEVPWRRYDKNPDEICAAILLPH